MNWFAYLCLVVGIPYLFWALWQYCYAMTVYLMAQEEKDKRMTTENATALIREQKLDLFEDAVTWVAHMDVEGMPVNVTQRSPEFQAGFELAIEVLANLAEGILEQADALTGDRVDMTEDEKAEAAHLVGLINAYAPDPE